MQWQAPMWWRGRHTGRGPVVGELAARLELVAPVMWGGVAVRAVVLLQVRRRNAVCHRPDLVAQDVAGTTHAELNTAQRRQ